MARKKSSKEVASDNAIRLDLDMNRALREGGDPLIDSEGKVVLDGKGNVVRRRLSAAAWNAIRGRLKDLGVQSVPKPGTAAGSLVETARLRFAGKPIPPVNTEDRDAATG